MSRGSCPGRHCKARQKAQGGEQKLGMLLCAFVGILPPGRIGSLFRLPTFFPSQRQIKGKMAKISVSWGRAAVPPESGER